jgi:nucleotide-binding universal stress UspA family protein
LFDKNSFLNKLYLGNFEFKSFHGGKKMFKKIMIMVDNSPIMENVIEYVTTLFPNSFYYLYSIVNLGAFTGYYSKIVSQQMREMSSDTLRNLSLMLESKGIKFNLFLDEGDPVSSSLAFARKNEVDLFVLETHSGLYVNKIKLGSTTASLIENSHIPVFLLGEELMPVKSPKIVHPTSGSKYSEKATYLAGELAKFWQGNLTTLIFRGNKEMTKKRVVEIFDSIGVKSEFYLSEEGEVPSIINFAKSNDIIIGSRGSPRPTYKFRFLIRSFALDPTVKLAVAFLPKPLLLVCD